MICSTSAWGWVHRKGVDVRLVSWSSAREQGTTSGLFCVARDWAGEALRHEAQKAEEVADLVAWRSSEP